MSKYHWLSPVSIFALAAILGYALWQDLATSRLSKVLEGSIIREAALVRDVQQLDTRIDKLEVVWAHGRRTGQRYKAVEGTNGEHNAVPAVTAYKAPAQETRRTIANLNLLYLPALLKLGVSSDQIDRWAAASSEYFHGLQDIDAAAADQGLAVTDPGIIALKKAEADELKSQEDEIFGSAIHAQLQAFYRVVPAATLTGEVAGIVSATDSPLTALQGHQLTQILAEASTTYQQGGSVTSSSIDWSAVMTHANGALSARQLQVLQAVGGEYQARLQVQQRIASLLNNP